MAANIAVPTQAMTLPVSRGSTRASPQLSAPVMMKLSAAPSSARPSSRIATDATGAPTKGSDRR
jgi:hypothetical protein